MMLRGIPAFARGALIVPAITIGAGCGGTTISPSSGGDGGSSIDAENKFDGPTRNVDGGSMDAKITLDAPTTGHDAGPSPGFTPPDAPSGPATTSTTPQNFAIHQLFLGDTDFEGNPSSTAWAGFGYNIDGKITTVSSTNVCTLQPGASTAVQIDGNGGTDNSFGENVVSLIGSLVSSSTVDSEIDMGSFTGMFDVTGLISDPTQTSTMLGAQAFTGGNAGTTPDWTSGTFNWPILGGSAFLSNPSGPPPYESTIQFADSYVVNGTWVSGSPQSIDVDISFDGVALTLPIAHAVITFEHTTAPHAAHGIISGVMPVTSFANAIERVAADKGYCSVVGDFLPELEQDADIMSDGTNDPGMTCDAISIGLGFTADQIGQPATVAPVADAGGPTTCDAGM